MRKIILFVCLSFVAGIASAQIAINGSKYVSIQKIIGTDTTTVLIIDGMSNTDITYTGNGTTINWYKYSNGINTFYSSFKTIYPEDGSGYSLNVDGHVTHIWVIDHKLYKPISIEPVIDPANQCQNVTVNFSIPTMVYKTFNGVSQILQRDFKIKYKTLSWQDGTGWVKVDTTTQTIITPATQKSIPTPYCDTKFTLYGDQFATDMGINQDSISSSLYLTNAVISKLKTNVTSRDQGTGNNNEADFPSSKIPISFSAPIDVLFLSNANEPITQYYLWGIYKDSKLLISRTDKDNRYTFTEVGTYVVKLTVSNARCSFSDSLTIIVSESALYVPNVFTPNGDGLNDEFRVAYKSLLTFQCWVYNRWGRQVFTWTDPTKGWDGNINGKKAVPGPYFYVIKATGSDKKKYKLSGDINLLRGSKN